jgi:hypothetical protein
MKITFEHTRPHVTLSLFHCEDSKKLADAVLEQLDLVAKTLATTPTHPQEVKERLVVRLEPQDAADVSARGAWYVIRKPPAWFHVAEEEGGEIEDEEEESLDGEPPSVLDIDNHLVVLIAYRKYLGVFATQDTMRSRLNELVEFGMTGDENRTVNITITGAPLKRDEVEKAFVRGNTRSAWFQGLHAPTVMKADRKIMSGPDLRYALDQFGDQTFMYTAAISEFGPDVTGLN